jgi:hypothetical protein
MPGTSSLGCRACNTLQSLKSSREVASVVGRQRGVKSAVGKISNTHLGGRGSSRGRIICRRDLVLGLTKISVTYNLKV